MALRITPDYFFEGRTPSLADRAGDHAREVLV